MDAKDLLNPDRYELISESADRAIGHVRRPGAFYKAFGAGSKSMAIDTADSLPYVDRAAMSARAVISTASVDRVGDLLMPMGIQLDNYRLNPAVLWDHGLGAIATPIATSEAPDGSLAIQVTENEIVATGYFSNRNLESEQIFQLIDDGLVRGTSVRETPLSERKFRDKETGEIVTQVDSWDLEEWSWCGVGVNPDAVAKALNGRVAGRRLCESVVKSLMAFAPQRKPQGIGLPSERSVMKTDNDNDDPDKVGTTGLAQHDTSGDNKPADEVDDDGKGADGEDESDKNKPSETEAADPEQDQLYGRQVIGAAHDGIKSLRCSLRRAMKCMDNPAVKSDIQDHHDRLGAELPTLQGMRKEHYPESSELKDEDPGDDDAGGDDEMKSVNALDGDDDPGSVNNNMKSMFATLKSSRYTAGGLVHDIQSVLKSCRGLSRAEQAKLQRASDGLSRLIEQSKASATSKTPVAKSASASDDEAKKQDIARQIAELNSKLPKTSKV